MIKKASLLWLVCVLGFVASCSVPVEESKCPEEKELKGPEVVEIKIVPLEVSQEKTYSAWSILGYDFDSREFYLKLIANDFTHHLLGMYDAKDGEKKREIKVSKGSMQSPSDCYSPNYMQRQGDMYYIVDQYDKILEYDLNFKFLRANMFHQLRYFMDFYKIEDRNYFLMGTKVYADNEKSRGYKISQYRLSAKKKPKHVQTLSETYFESFDYLNSKEEKKRTFSGYFFPSVKGFEKGGKLYWSETTEPNFYVYDQKDLELDRIGLTYLKGRMFTKEEAEIAGRYRNKHLEETILKRFGRKYVYLPFKEKTYYWGLYDVGKDKIGIIGDIDLENLKIRLDIFTTNHEYVESYLLQAGWGFFNSISSQSYPSSTIYFDWDKRIYLYSDKNEEDEENYVKYIKFKK